ncbi:MAG: hypothetical protein ABIG44_03260 [Planctomycetota bacterium]
MSPLEHARISPSAASNTVYWIIAILLAIIATALWIRPTGELLPSAHAQNQPLVGARGVFAFTGPLDRNHYGLFMLDVDQGTIWCYELETVGGSRKLRLIAARTWIYDRYLQDFNCAQPDFRMVQKLVAEQRAQMDGRTAPAETTDEDAPPSDGD